MSSSEKEITVLLSDKERAISRKAWKEVAEICNYLGNLYSERGRLSQALAEHQEELKICSHHLKDDKGCALAHRRIGEVYSSMEDYKKALTSIRTYLQMAEKMKDIVEIQRAWMTLGRTYLLKEDLERAHSSFKMALKLAER